GMAFRRWCSRTIPNCWNSPGEAGARACSWASNPSPRQTFDKAIRDSIHPPDYARVVERLHAHGIALQGCFVFGLDDDKPDIFLKTAKFAVSAGIDLPRFAVVTPFPSTALYKRLESEGRILTKDWELYDGQHVVFQPRHMSVRELQLGIEAAWKHAYSISSLVRRIRRSPAPWPVRLGTNLGSRFYAHNLRRLYHWLWVLR